MLIFFSNLNTVSPTVHRSHLSSVFSTWLFFLYVNFPPHLYDPSSTFFPPQLLNISLFSFPFSWPLTPFCSLPPPPCPPPFLFFLCHILSSRINMAVFPPILRGGNSFFFFLGGVLPKRWFLLSLICGRRSVTSCASHRQAWETQSIFWLSSCLFCGGYEKVDWRR